MTEIFANDLFGLSGVVFQYFFVGLLCIAVVKSVPGDGSVSFLLAFLYDLVTILGSVEIVLRPKHRAFRCPRSDNHRGAILWLENIQHI